MQPDPHSDLDAMVADLRAKLDADEASAESARTADRWWVDGPATQSGHWWVYEVGVKFKSRAVAEHIVRQDPARVLALVAAHRRLLDDLLAEQHRACAAEPGGHDSCSCGRDERVLRRVRYLAAAYADRDESGRPLPQQEKEG